MANPVNLDIQKSLFPAGSQGVATYVSADQSNIDRRGAIFYVNVSAGTGTVTVTIPSSTPTLLKLKVSLLAGSHPRTGFTAIADVISSRYRR